MKRLIVPKKKVNIDYPLIFLAGPIGGAPNWQDEAVEYILAETNEVVVASPRWDVSEPLTSYVMQSESYDFPRARLWERHYFQKAQESGSVLFWLPGEKKHSCEKVYGAMTRFELGQCLNEYKNNKKTRFCIGSDSHFPELRTILCDLEIDAPEKEIFGTLEDTCDEAIRMCTSIPYSN